VKDDAQHPGVVFMTGTLTLILSRTVKSIAINGFRMAVFATNVSSKRPGDR
jgi:hypothetical protein